MQTYKVTVNGTTWDTDASSMRVAVNKTLTAYMRRRREQGKKGEPSSFEISVEKA